MVKALKNYDDATDFAINERWTGRGRLRDLLTELERQREVKADFIGDTRQMEIVTNGNDGDGGGALMLRPRSKSMEEFLPPEGMPILPQALDQLGHRQTPPVPGKFLRQLAGEKPQTAVRLLNDLLGDENRRMVRCLDGQVRGFLSNSYKIMDNIDFGMAALNAIREADGKVIECSLTDRHMRIKFTSANVFAAIDNKMRDLGAAAGGNHTFLRGTDLDSLYKEGDDLPAGPGTIHPIVTIRNSETGHGGLSVSIGILQAYCINTAIMEKVMRHVHLGGKQDEGFYRDETMAADAKAVTMKAQDAITASMDPTKFQALIKKLEHANSLEVKEPTAAVKVVESQFHLSEDQRDKTLEYFLSDYDRTAYGLAQAVGRLAQDVNTVQGATDLEEAAGTIILKPRQFAIAS